MSSYHILPVMGKNECARHYKSGFTRTLNISHNDDTYIINSPYLKQISIGNNLLKIFYYIVTTDTYYYCLILSANVPDELKIVRIVPIYKAADNQILNNDRPTYILLACALCLTENAEVSTHFHWFCANKLKTKYMYMHSIIKPTQRNCNVANISLEIGEITLLRIGNDCAESTT